MSFIDSQKDIVCLLSKQTGAEGLQCLGLGVDRV